MADQPQMARILLPNDDGNVERLWATPVGHNQYRLENSPFYAYRVSWMDIVEAQPVAPDEWPTFRCDLSLFQLGLRLLEHFPNEAMPVPVAFLMLDIEFDRKPRY